MRSLAILCLVLAVMGCRTQIAFKAGAVDFAIGTSLADPRISEGQIDIDSEGAQVYMSKKAASPEFLHMIEVVLPEVVAQAVKAALISAGIGAAGNAVNGLDGLLVDTPTEVIEEVAE